jgi:hypothetical protein
MLAEQEVDRRSGGFSRAGSGRGFAVLLSAIFALATATGSPARALPPAEDQAALSNRFRARVEELLAPNAKKGVYVGSEGWLFLRTEIQGAAGLSPCPPPGEGDKAGSPGRTAGEPADALAAIDDFAEQLRRRGIPLLFVLIPPKFDIYPDRLFADFEPLALDLGEGQRHFLAELARRGIPVLDLAPLFRAERAKNTEPLYGAQDTHWTSYAARLAARAIAARLRAMGIASGPGMALEEEATTAEYCGDLREKIKAQRPPCSPLTLHSLRAPGSGQLAGTVARESPILLLGDSSSVIYHEPSRAGLVDHLAVEMGEPIDLLAVMAGGANGAREALARRGEGPGNLGGKKVAIWVVSGRLIYECSPWKKVALAREGTAADAPNR